MPLAFDTGSMQMTFQESQISCCQDIMRLSMCMAVSGIGTGADTANLRPKMQISGKIK